MSDPHAAAKNAFFQKLKPHCATILKLSSSTDKKAASKDLIHEAEELYLLLDKVPTCGGIPVLDHKLADYVFLPLSNVLRYQEGFPVRLVELVIKCLTILVEVGWKSKLPIELAQQLIILLAFIIGGSPGQETRRSIFEETETEAFKAFTAVVKATGSSTAGAASLVEAKAIPALGHAVSVVLDGVTSGRTADIQIEALQAIEAIYVAIRDRSALATFLPGIVSALSKLLSLPIAPKTQRRVLVRGIEVLATILTAVLGDIRVMTLLPKTPTPMDNHEMQMSEESTKVLTPSWLKATAAKVQVALAHIFKLRSHTEEDVRLAISRLCLQLLDECHQSLSNCAPILVETAMVLSQPETGYQLQETRLEDLARIHPELCDSIKTVVYNWEGSLARQMQASDEKLKVQAINNLTRGHKMITSLQISSSVLDSSLATSLRDMTAAALANAVPSDVDSVTDLLQIKEADQKHERTPTFAPIVYSRAQQASTRTALTSFLREISTSSEYAWLPAAMLSQSRESSGEQRVAALWLCFELLKPRLAQNSAIDDFLDLSSAGEPEDSAGPLFDELYAYSVSILDTRDDEDSSDWRLQALALEITSFAASQLKEKFRPELIDVLYPITTCLGAATPLLRQHAIISLNSIAASCGYQGVTDLVVDNVDYMINSYSLRLNTFDITPASTQVLRMMVQLSGPQLVPYLDDVVASIFGALDNYHGYPAVVEGLFEVLGEIANQGAASRSLQITDMPEEQRMDQPKSATRQIDFNDVQNTLDIILARHERHQREQQDDVDYVAHPERPWRETPSKTAEKLLDEREGADDSEAEAEESPNAEEKPAPPKTPTFKILTRIMTFTQHYMTSPTPTLRKSLLDLICIVSPAIALDEEAFLPIVNTIWPVTMERLYDPETFVVLSACKALAALFESSGSFLSSRVKTEWWDQLGRWFADKKAAALQHRVASTNTSKSMAGMNSLILTARPKAGATNLVDPGERLISSTLGQFTHASQVWEAARALLTALVSSVRVDDEIFDAILELVSDDLGKDDGLRKAMEVVDVDSVWLQMYERGLAGGRRQPEVASQDFARI